VRGTALQQPVLLAENSCKNLKFRKLSEKRCRKRAERTEITQDRVLKELGRLAFLDIRKAFNSDGSLKPIHELDDETAAAIAGLEVSEIMAGENSIGSLKKIRLSDKKGALELIGRHLKMWNDKLDITATVSIADAIRARIAQRAASNG
jgi:phage terminase small subunit